MKRIPIWRSISFSIAVFVLISVISKNVLIKIISKFNLLIFAFFALEVFKYYEPFKNLPTSSEKEEAEAFIWLVQQPIKVTSSLEKSY